jgi:transcription elongation GreA/GreB family factor
MGITDNDINRPCGMDTNCSKTNLIRLIIGRLTTDLELFNYAAKTAHKASIDEENQPDNKYDTLALEASYVAQGQANRAQELRRSIETYKKTGIPPAGKTIRLTSLVTLEDGNGNRKRVFIGPAEGGLRIDTEEGAVTVITLASPLGRALISKTIDDPVVIMTGRDSIKYHILEVI